MRSERTPTALAVGHLTHDRHGDAITPGGSALFAALAFRALGAKAAIVTAHGMDFGFPELFEGIEKTVIDSARTTIFEISYPEGGPRVMRVETPAVPVTPAEVSIPEHVDIAFLAPVVGEVPLTPWVERLTDAAVRIGTSVRIGIGLQGFLKRQGPPIAPTSAQHTLVPRRFAPEAAVLRQIHAVFLSEEDLSGYGSAALLSRLRDNVPVVAVTDGDRGAMIYEGGDTFHVGVLPVSAVDPTGAGDTFAAAFLYAIATGRSTEAAARLGAAAAGRIVEGLGVAPALSLANAFEEMAKVPVTRPAGPSFRRYRD